MAINFLKVVIPLDPKGRDHIKLAKQIADIVVLSSAWQSAVALKSPVLALAVYDAAFFQVVKDKYPIGFESWMIADLMNLYCYYEVEMNHRAEVFSWWD